MIMKLVALGLGSNLGDRKENLLRATSEIAEAIGKIIRISPFFETEPWGFQAKEQFLNMALIAETELVPEDILETIKSIETGMGRLSHGRKYESRTIDIDILLYDSTIIKRKDLIVPHPHMHDRKFVLAPLSEIAGEMIHPVFKKSISELLASCSDTCSIRRI